LFESFDSDCVYFQRSCNVTNLERVNLLQEQVAATLLDPRNMPDLNCIPPDQHDQGWSLLHRMVIAVIDEFKNSDASTDVNTSEFLNYSPLVGSVGEACTCYSFNFSSSRVGW